MRRYTMGFTKKPTSKFVGLLKRRRAKRIVDVRLNNSSQLAGFAKRDDLEFFQQHWGDVEIDHLV